jgi:glycosyltransferase involved in cell wall biosynthesis
MEEAQKDRPRILVLTSTYPRWRDDVEPGFVHELCRRLTDRYDLSVLAPHAPGAAGAEEMDGVAVRRFRYLPGRWETLAYEGGIPARLRREPWRLFQVPFFFIAQFLAILGELKRRRPALMHAHWILPQGLTAVLAGRAGAGNPAVVCTSHGADLFAFNAVPFRWFKSLVLRNVQALTVVSEAMVPMAVRLGASPHSVRVAPMGVEMESRFAPCAGHRRETDLVLFAGRLVEKKGVRYLIESFSRIREAMPAARLCIAGDGPDRRDLEALAEARGLAGVVTFPGALRQEDLAGLYRSAAVSVFPFVVAAGGDQEGLGLVVVEAQACECPVVVSDIPAVRDTVADGETGLLAPPGDVEQLADRVLRILRDRTLAGRLGRAGRQAALARFNWEIAAARYRELFEQVLAGRSAG